ncbi:MAG: Gfo/Idh/MocA family oxidoreductase [Chloroflexi bacterium]|nr:Gfo/Idh/MocA family oxidoreductase [Chloroflexota bacterium]
MNTPITVAIAGAGMVTGHHMPAWTSDPRVRVIGICDRDIDKARSRAAEFDIPAVFDGVDRMLDALRPDALDIALPPAAHGIALRAAAERGIAALCQKPLAPTLEEAQALAMELAGGPRVMVHENWRWRAHYRVLKDWLKRGALGSPVTFALNVMGSGLVRRPDGRVPALERQPFFADLDRFLVIEVLVHHLDTLAFLFGPVEIAGARLSVRAGTIAAEDTAVIALVAGGVAGTVTATAAAGGEPPLPNDRLLVHGTHASALLDDWTLRCSDPEIAEHVGSYDEGYPAAYAAAIRHFVDCLESGTPFETGMREGIAALRAVEAVYAHNGEGTAT